MNALRCKILKQLSKGVNGPYKWNIFTEFDETPDNLEFTEQVTEELIELWQQGYIEANVDRIDSNDPNSPYARPTNIQLTDKGLQAVAECK